MQSTFPNGEVGRGTATLINKNFLITAGHCLYDRDEGGLATEVSIFFGRSGNRFLKKCISNKFIVHPEYFENNENYDFSLIHLTENVGNELGWASLKVLSDKELEQKRVNVAGYPGTKGFFRTLFSLPSYSLYTMEGQIVSLKKHKMYYHIDTSGGQSGAGVFLLNNGIADCIAIHTTGKSPREEGNGAIRINEENFNIITDWMNSNKE